MTKKKKICVITGSRADYGILSNLLKELQSSASFDLKVIVTCMHLIAKYGNTYKEILNDKIKIYKKIKLPIHGDTAYHISKATGAGINLFAKELIKLKPNFVIILGDRFEALSFAISSLFLKIPIIHIHGGESTYAAVDDPIRHSITKMANVHFVSNEFYRKRIISMGEDPKSVHTLGSLAINNLKKIKFFSKKEIEKQLNFKFDKKNIIFTLHPETLGNNKLEKKIKPILEILKRLKNTKIIFTMPNIDVGNKKIFKTIYDFNKFNKKKSILIKSMGQKLYFSTLKLVDLVIGNSSSGIIEVPSFNIPSINLGKRQLGRISSKSVIHCKFDKKEFERKLKISLSKNFIKKINNMKNPYFKKNTVKNMIKLMKRINFKKGTQKIFYEK